jgi:hypothetical protein
VNLFVRFGNWLEARRVVRWPDLEAQYKALRLHDTNEMKTLEDLIIASNEGLNKRITELQASAPVIPQQVAKEMALLKVRLERLELYVGLKRDPKPEPVPGAAKIG